MKTLEQLIETTQEHFSESFHEAPSFVAYAPGRINIIGEHTDYNQGLSMPCAINRWITVGMSSRADDIIHITSINFESEMHLEIDADYEPQNIWEKYIYGCIKLFRASYKLPSGFNAVIVGNVPIGSGVSSSAALEVAFITALNHLSQSNLDGLSLIKLCQQVEHQYLEVKSGLLDQYASEFSKANEVLVLDFNDLSHQYIEADTKGYVWVLCDSKVKRTLAGSKYSERVQETQKALQTLHEKIPEVKEFRDIEEEHISLIEDITLQKRIRHYYTENKRVRDVIKAFESKNLLLLGKLITASHISLRDDYEVSCKEIDYLVEQALATDYCIGSRIMGGGFGGCTINLVKEKYVRVFSADIQNLYFNRFNIEAEINTYQSVDGAGIFPVLSDVQYHS
jgi:galactokinase